MTDKDYNEMYNEYIRLDPLDNKPRKHKPAKLTDQEKTARLYALAEKLHVKIGVKR